jgi:hypothetical protein
MLPEERRLRMLERTKEYTPEYRAKHLSRRVAVALYRSPHPERHGDVERFYYYERFGSL